MAKCHECGANVDLAKDSNLGHCATCNTIVEVKEEDRSGKPAEPKKDDDDDDDNADHDCSAAGNGEKGAT